MWYHQWQKQNRSNARAFLALMLPVLMAVLAGCSNSPKAPARPAVVSVPTATTQQRTTVSVPTGTSVPKAEVHPEDVYSYQPAGRRDPFMPLISKKENRPRSGELPPLERYNISEFKLSGIIWGGFGYNALLDAPDGKGYFVRVGSIIGPNRGVIKRITQNAIVIEERFKNEMGETQRKEITVELRKKQEGRP